jgi:hypothetical protein
MVAINVFYTDRFIDDWAVGCARGPLIFIRPKYKEDKGLLAHEQVHVKQWFKTLALHPFLYLFSAKYRYKSELEAYKEQLKYSPDKASKYAEFIKTRYNLSIDYDRVLEDLTS